MSEYKYSLHIQNRKQSANFRPMEFDRDEILDGITQSGVSYRQKGKMLWVCCPFHGDTNPSLSIIMTKTNKWPVGFFKCFACGAVGMWPKLAAKLGVKVKHSQYSVSDKAINNLNYQLSLSTKDYQIPKGLEIWKGSWRGLSESFLTARGCKKMYDDKASEYRLWIPAESDGHIAARLEGSTIEPKYDNSPNLETSKILFGLSWINLKHKTVILTEGPYDALRLQAAGLPAVAILGTQNWSTTKLSLLAGRGVTKIILAFDADKAGEVCTIKVEEEAKNGFDVGIFPWSDGHDPGNAPIEEVEALKKYFEKFKAA